MGPRREPAHLRCIQCGEEAPLGPHFEGCPACAASGKRKPFEVIYDYARLRAIGTLAAWSTRPGGLWRFAELLPLPEGAVPITLAEGATPLVRLELPGPARIWVKDETRNPTGAFKDRFHAVSVWMARALGYRKVTASTTGNHGTSVSAYAAKGGLVCLVFCDPQAPDVQRRLMQLFGARVAVLAHRRQHLTWLVRERGWYPSTYMTPMPVCTPYGVEGYKTIGYEIFFQLGGRMPSRVLFPTAAGDGLYGPWKGFRELELLGASAPLPKMIAVQATGCDPIVQGFNQRAREVPVHPNSRTIAVSIADETGGAISLTTLYGSGGSAVAVSDEAILEAMRTLARLGIAVESTSAAPLAAVMAQQARGELGEDEDVVCILTGAGGKWPDALLDALDDHELREQDPEALRAWIGAFDVDKPPLGVRG